MLPYKKTRAQNADQYQTKDEPDQGLHNVCVVLTRGCIKDLDKNNFEQYEVNVRNFKTILKRTVVTQ